VPEFSLNSEVHSRNLQSRRGMAFQAISQILMRTRICSAAAYRWEKRAGDRKTINGILYIQSIGLRLRDD
jgi:hypothetical protein